MRKLIMFFIFFGFVVVSPGLLHAGQFQRLHYGAITIRYESGLAKSAEKVALVLPEVEREIREKLNLVVSFPYQVDIYKNQGDFHRLTKNKEFGAFAEPERNLIAINSKQISDNHLSLKSLVLHELSHLVLHGYIKNNPIPKWFDEGVAQWINGADIESINPHATVILNKGFSANYLYSLAEISQTFPSEKIHIHLAYQQSRSIVKYIEEIYGKRGLLGIISNLHNGIKMEQAVNNSLQTSLKDLEHGWSNSLKATPEKTFYVASMSGKVIPLIFLFLCLGYFYGGRLLKWYENFHQKNHNPVTT